jgi:hypothetical protein
VAGLRLDMAARRDPEAAPGDAGREAAPAQHRRAAFARGCRDRTAVAIARGVGRMLGGAGRRVGPARAGGHASREGSAGSADHIEAGCHVALQWCYSGVIVVLQWFYSGVGD